MLPIRQTLRLTSGSVTLRAWPETVAQAHLTDLLTLTVTLGAAREEWHALSPGDIEPRVWAAFDRLLDASVQPGSALPRPLSWADYLTALEALWTLNDLEDADPKLTASLQSAGRMLARLNPPRRIQP